MQPKYFLTIQGIDVKGKNFKTQIDSFNFPKSFPEPLDSGSGNFSLTLKQARSPLSVYRKRDKHSNVFARLAFMHNHTWDKGGSKEKETFPKGNVMTDYYGQNAALRRRMIYDFSDLEVVGFSEWVDYENIVFEFKDVSVYDSSIEMITVP